MNKHLHFGFALLLVVATTACQDKPQTCGIPESKQECACSDGRTGGSQTCHNEVWTECVCPGEPIVVPDGGADAQVEAGPVTDGSTDTDSGADSDSGASSDSGTQ